MSLIIMTKKNIFRVLMNLETISFYFSTNLFIATGLLTLNKKKYSIRNFFVIRLAAGLSFIYISLVLYFRFVLS